MNPLPLCWSAVYAFYPKSYGSLLRRVFRGQGKEGDRGGGRHPHLCLSDPIGNLHSIGMEYPVRKGWGLLDYVDGEISLGK